MMAAIMTVFAAAGLVVSEKKTKTMLLQTPNQALRTPPLVIEAAGQRYRRATQFLYLGCRVNARPTLCQISKRRVQLAWACYKRFKRKLYNMEASPFTLTVRVLKVVMETLQHGCVTWTLGKEHVAEL